MVDSSLHAKLIEVLPAMGREATILAIAIAFLICLQRRHLLLSRFFSASADPLNLAVVRVVVFSALLLQENYARILRFTQLPKALQLPPVAWPPILKVFPVNGHVVAVLYAMFAAACIAAILGIFTRCSCLLAALLAIYVLGVPQLYGKVNHYHHLVWFALILGFSRCGDALSIDSLLAAIKRADKGEIEAPVASGAYGLPLRFMMAALALVYFFPGTWKLARGGWGWIFGDNLRIQMYQKWAEFGYWTPWLRVDHFPWLTTLLALSAVTFEITFGLLILWPRLRPLAALAGLAFHNGIGMMMRIPFLSLQFMYVIFVDWKGLFVAIGKNIFPGILPVIYDDSCKLCRRTVAILQSLNWASRVQFVGCSDHASLIALGAEDTCRQATPPLFTALAPEGRVYGYKAYMRLVPRLPLLSFLTPILRLAPVQASGERIYARVAESRACSLVPVRAVVSSKQAATPSTALWCAGVSLLAVNVLCGSFHIVRSWPFACYPTFDRIQKAELHRLIASVEMYSGAHQEYELSHDAVMARIFSAERWQGLTYRVEETPAGDLSANQLHAMWELWREYHSIPDEVRSVSFYEETVPVDFDGRLTAQRNLRTAIPSRRLMGRKPL
ncbi:MAG TPA: DCC1-like thiol-disulfide oxidoreductase family protein [Candidatus Sulfotelmatobacter sp.]|nr:DCC1-like thiol-disulfide oxidoreductase family protein [Candidatus Sulfotelmatobacter sp.]